MTNWLGVCLFKFFIGKLVLMHFILALGTLEKEPTVKLLLRCQQSTQVHGPYPCCGRQEMEQTKYVDRMPPAAPLYELVHSPDGLTK